MPMPAPALSRLCGIFLLAFKRGCCIRSPLATKLLHVVLFCEDNTQRDLKKSSPWYTCDLSLHRVSAMSVHCFGRYEHVTEPHFHFLWSDFVACSRNLWTTQIPCNNYNYSEYRVLKTPGLNPVFQRKNQFWKIFIKSSDIGKNVSGLFRDFCYKQQNQTTKNENGTETWCRLRSHVYQGLEFFRSLCVMSS